MSQKKVKKRHNEILNILGKKKSAEIEELAEALEVHEMTIRRDLKQLEDTGYVIRTLGGATKLPSRYLGYSSRSEQEFDLPLKQKIAKYIAKNLIKSGETLFISSGTLCLELIKQIHNSDIKDLKILSTSVDVISYLFAKKKYDLITPGGQLRFDSPCLFGEYVIENLEKFKENEEIDKIFIEVDAVVNEEGYCGFMQNNNFEISIFPTILNLTSSENIYLMATSPCFEKIALFEICQFSKINKIITNSLKSNIKSKFSEVINQIIEV